MKTTKTPALRMDEVCIEHDLPADCVVSVASSFLVLFDDEIVAHMARKRLLAINSPAINSPVIKKPRPKKIRH